MTVKFPKYRTIFKFLGQAGVILFLTLCLFEVAYRYYWIDFYKEEINGLNSEEDLSLSKSKTILVFGDSFSAQQDGWVSNLRDDTPEVSIINSAIPGTTVFHQGIIFEDRINDYSPDLIIIQLYVGNDLIDYYRPINFFENNFFKNIYWSLSDRFISLQYLNYKMGQFSFSSNKPDPKNDKEFDLSTYNQREIQYHRSDSMILNNSIHLEGPQKEVFDELLTDLTNMLEAVQVPVYILVIPHNSQISHKNREQTQLLGAHLNGDTLENFPFYAEIEKWTKTKSDITAINAFSKLENWNNKHPVYYNNDPHLNSFGEKAITSLILETIELKNF